MITPRGGGVNDPAQGAGADPLGREVGDGDDELGSLLGPTVIAVIFRILPHLPRSWICTNKERKDRRQLLVRAGVTPDDARRLNTRKFETGPGVYDGAIMREAGTHTDAD